MPGPANPTGDRLDVVDTIEDNGGRDESITSSILSQLSPSSSLHLPSYEGRGYNM